MTETPLDTPAATATVAIWAYVAKAPSGISYEIFVAVNDVPAEYASSVSVKDVDLNKTFNLPYISARTSYYIDGSSGSPEYLQGHLYRVDVVVDGVTYSAQKRAPGGISISDFSPVTGVDIIWQSDGNMDSIQLSGSGTDSLNAGEPISASYNIPASNFTIGDNDYLYVYARTYHYNSDGAFAGTLFNSYYSIQESAQKNFYAVGASPTPTATKIDQWEPDDNDWTTAPQLTPGVHQAHVAVMSYNQEDWAKFIIPFEMVFSVMTGGTANASNNTLMIYNSADVPSTYAAIDYSGSAGNGHSIITCAGWAPGTYYARVGTYNDNPDTYILLNLMTFTATLTVTTSPTITQTPTIAPTPDPWEAYFDDACSNRRPIDFGECQLRNLWDTDWDWVFFTVNAHAVVEITTSGTDAGGDTLIELFYAECSGLVMSDDNGNGGGYSKMQVVLTPGVYSLKVTSLTTTYNSGGAMYDYNLCLSGVVVTPSCTSTPTPTFTATRTITMTATDSPTKTATGTHSITPTVTDTVTVTATITSTPAPDWNSTGLSAPVDGYSSCLAVSAAGLYQAYLAGMAPDNYMGFRKYNGTDWDTVGPTTIKSWGAGRRWFTVDEAGSLYFAFNDASNNVIAYKDGAQLGGIIAANSYQPVVYVEPMESNRLYVAYIEGDAGYKVNVKYYDGSNWVQYAVNYASPRVYQAATSGSIAMDGYYNGGLCNLFVAYAAGDGTGNSRAAVSYYDYFGGWLDVAGYASTGAASGIDIRINSYVPFISFTDLGNAGKAIVKRGAISGLWTYIAGVPASAGGGTDSSLYVVSTSEIYAAYSDGAAASRQTVSKYTLASSAWSSLGTAGFSSGASSSGSIVLYNGVPFCSFIDAGEGSAPAVWKYSY